MKMKIRENLNEQFDILNSWDLMHIMRQMDQNKRRQHNIEKRQSNQANALCSHIENDMIEDEIIFHS